MQHHTDYKLGVAMIDRFTYATLDYFEHNKVAEDSANTLQQLVRTSARFQSLSRVRVLSTIPPNQFTDENYRYLGAQSNYRTDLFSRPLSDARIPLPWLPDDSRFCHTHVDHSSRPSQVLLTDFFGSVMPVQTTARAYPLGE